MRIVDPMPFLGQASGMRDVVLSPREISTLASAARILHALREIIEKENGEDAGTDVALAAYTVDDLVTEGKIKL